MAEKKHKSVNAASKEQEVFKMCFTNDGKYFVDGKEILIDYNEDVPIEILKQLEKCSMNQLDAFYIRKRLHQLARTVEKFVDVIIVHQEQSIDLETVEKIAGEKVTEIEEQLPTITAEVVHQIVNGKFANVEMMFAELKEIQVDTVTMISEIDKKNEQNFKLVHDRIEYTINKTIFGWIKNQYEINPVKTLFFSVIISAVLFLMILQLFHVWTNTEIINIVKKMIGL